MMQMPHDEVSAEASHGLQLGINLWQALPHPLQHDCLQLPDEEASSCGARLHPLDLCWCMFIKPVPFSSTPVFRLAILQLTKS